MSNVRALPYEVSSAIDRAVATVAVPWARVTPPLRVFLPVAGVTREVAHGLDAVPDGFFVVFADAPILAVAGLPWTRTLAYLTSTSANARAIVIFYTLKETPAHA